jgi:hypothetical protein
MWIYDPAHDPILMGVEVAFGPKAIGSITGIHSMISSLVKMTFIISLHKQDTLSESSDEWCCHTLIF